MLELTGDKLFDAVLISVYDALKAHENNGYGNRQGTEALALSTAKIIEHQYGRYFKEEVRRVETAGIVLREGVTKQELDALKITHG